MAVSRFKAKHGCYVFGKLRRTDFLPVDPRPSAEEVLERGDSSATSSEGESGVEFVGGFGEGWDSDDSETCMNLDDSG